jgi:hypothetical protein
MLANHQQAMRECFWFMFVAALLLRAAVFAIASFASYPVSVNLV